MSTQPIALLLAEKLEQQFPLGTAQHYLDGEAAAELRRLHAEVEEQCRLNGMGSEREAALMAQVERKSEAIQRLWKERDELRAVNEELLEALEEYVNADPVDDALNPRKRKARAAIAKATGEQA